MPGPVSDSYDPEFGTAETCHRRDALQEVYNEVSEVLGNRNPIFIVDLIRAELPWPVKATFTEKQWRLIRFALERAKESI